MESYGDSAAPYILPGFLILSGNAFGVIPWGYDNKLNGVLALRTWCKHDFNEMNTRDLRR